MPFFQPGEDLPERSFIPHKLLREESWGEIWQALNRSSATNVLLIAYTTPDGDALFEHSAPGLRRWKEVAGTLACPHLLRILEINDSAIPFILVEDPGGSSLRDYVTNLKDVMKFESAGKLARQLGQAIAAAEAYDCAPVGLSPATIFLCPNDKDHPWKLAPVAPRHKRGLELGSIARYLPPEYGQTDLSLSLHVDCYAIPWIIADAVRRDFDTPPAPLRDIVPLKAFCSLLESLARLNQGSYPDPSVVLQSVDRWLGKQMTADVEAWEKAESRRKRGAMGNFFADYGFRLVGVFLALFLAGGAAVGGYLVVKTHGAKPKKPTIERPLEATNPRDVATMFMLLVEQGDVPSDVTFLSEQGVTQTEALIVQLEDLEKSGRTMDDYAISLGGSYEYKVAEVTLLDEQGKELGLLAIELGPGGPGLWQVNDVFLTPAGS
jgi:hypothetical protein